MPKKIRKKKVIILLIVTTYKNYYCIKHLVLSLKESFRNKLYILRNAKRYRIIPIYNSCKDRYKCRQAKFYIAMVKDYNKGIEIIIKGRQ